jgi:hypothetical protein
VVIYPDGARFTCSMRENLASIMAYAHMYHAKYVPREDGRCVKCGDMLSRGYFHCRKEGCSTKICVECAEDHVRVAGRLGDEVQCVGCGAVESVFDICLNMYFNKAQVSSKDAMAAIRTTMARMCVASASLTLLVNPLLGAEVGALVRGLASFDDGGGFHIAFERDGKLLERFLRTEEGGACNAVTCLLRDATGGERGRVLSKRSAGGVVQVMNAFDLTDALATALVAEVR